MLQAITDPASPIDRLEGLRSVTVPALVHRRRAGRAVPRTVAAHGRRATARRARGDPRRRPLPAVRGPRRLVGRAVRVPRPGRAGSQRALSRKRSVSTTTRVTLPAATRPHASFTVTVKVRRRPSTRSSVASAATDEPTEVGARWSTCTRMPTVVWPGGTSSATAAMAASSHRAMTRGVARTGTSPGAHGDRGVGVGDDQLGAAVETGGEGHPGTIRPTLVAGTRRRTSHQKEPALLDEGLIQRTLDLGLRTGGELAEVFVEDRGQLERRVRRRQGREPLLGPRAGRRHPRDRGRHHRLRPHRRPLRGGPGRGGRGGRGRRPLRRRRRAGGGPHPPDARRGPTRCAILPEEVAKARKVELLRQADDAARSAGSAITPGDRPLRRQPPADPRSPTATACSPRTTRSARCFTVMAVASGDTGMQTGLPVARAAPSASSCSTATTSTDLARRGGAAGARQAGGPPGAVGHDAGRHRSGRRRRAVPRGLRPRPRGRPRGQGRVRVRRPDRRAGGRSPRSRWWTTARWARSGAASPSTTRAAPPPATS